MAAKNILKQLAKARAQVSKLEQAVAAKHNKVLARLPAQYGFDDVDAFLQAVRNAAKGGAGKRGAAKPATGGKRRKRAVITAETKAKVKSLAEAGKTGGEIAKTVGISLPSVQNIKRELGLTKGKKK
ncbi:MAG: helix-turn-helix domain-containing protein [Opitutaceae bacterium]|nr:helix-turn-helix domain-containing protein [Opitutaceae bacterium]